MLGCDPEFAFLDKHGNMVASHEVFKVYEPLIGSDGTSDAHAEFRPQPSKDITSFPIQFALGYVRLMQNFIEKDPIRCVNLIEDTDKGYVNFVAHPYYTEDWPDSNGDPCEACDYAEYDPECGGLMCTDGCNAYRRYNEDDEGRGGPFGGHIHIQKSMMNPKFKNIKFKPDKKNWDGRLTMYSEYGPHKDHEKEMLIMACMLDVALVEDFEEKIFHTDDIEQRREDSYGNKCNGYSVFRSMRTPCIEYRVPSTFLRSPSMTIAYMGITKYMLLWLRENFYGTNPNNQFVKWHKKACEDIHKINYDSIREQMSLAKLIKFIKTQKGREPKLLLGCIERCLNTKDIKAGGCIQNWTALFTEVEGMMNKLQRQLNV